MKCTVVIVWSGLLLCGHMVLSSSDVRHVTTLTGSTVTLDCRPSSPSYDSYFVWRFFSHSSLGGDQIYSYPPFILNADEFPASRYRQVDEYGLEISGVTWRDGGVYQCEFLTVQEKHQFHVIIIGQFLLGSENNTGIGLLGTGQYWGTLFFAVIPSTIPIRQQSATST